MQFLVIEDRSGCPVHVFLRTDPTGEAGYPGLPVVPVTLDRPPLRLGDGTVIGCHVGFPNYFREFESRQKVSEAPFVPVGPSFIGTTWGDYASDSRPAVQ